LQQLEKPGDIEGVMHRREGREMFLRQQKEPDGRPQSPAMLGMQRVLEMFLQMHERAGTLDQSLEKIVVTRVGSQPDLLEDIMGFVVALLVPALKEGAIVRMILHGHRGPGSLPANQLGDQL
jgi:hypothetical protein